jgi:hypothetical protein
LEEKEMRRKTAKRTLFILVATLLTVAMMAGQTSQQTPQQAPQKESIWQKLKNSAKQQGQNAAQQGTQQVQQGAQQVQQGAQQMQQQVQQQIPGNGGQTNMAPQTPCGSLTGGAGGGTLTNASYGTGAGSCGPQCFNAGPFAAAVTQMTMSQQGSWHVVRMNIQFHNTTNQPLIIAYREGSMVMVDNLGNTYQPAGGYAGAVQGIGIDRGSQTDSQFTLGPGQTGNAMFAVARIRGNQSAVANGYTYNFTIDELQPQNGAEAIAVRQYNLNFADLAAGANSAGFGGTGAAPSGSPASNIAGGGKGQAIGASAGSSYVGGAAPVAAPGQGAVNGVVGAAPVQGGVARGGAVTSAPNSRSVANPRAGAIQTQPGVLAPVRRGVVAQPVASAPVVAPTPQRPVNNAAMKSNAATVARPSVPVKPIPTKKPAGQQNTSATSK